MTTASSFYIVQIAHPKLLKEILQTDYLSFDRPHPFTKVFDDFAGGLLQQPNGHEWKEARGLFDKFFTAAATRQYMPLLQKRAQTLVQVIFRSQNNKQRLVQCGFDIEPLFQNYTFDTITEITFGKAMGSLENGGSPYLTSFKKCLRIQMMRFISGLLLPEFLNPKPKAYSEHLKHFRSLVTDNLKYRAKSSSSSSTSSSSTLTTVRSILDTILEDTEEKGGDMPEWMQANDEVLIKHVSC